MARLLLRTHCRITESHFSLGDEFIVGRTGFSINRFDYGISEAIGARPTMEDRSIVMNAPTF